MARFLPPGLEGGFTGAAGPSPPESWGCLISHTSCPRTSRCRVIFRPLCMGARFRCTTSKSLTAAQHASLTSDKKSRRVLVSQVGKGCSVPPGGLAALTRVCEPSQAERRVQVSRLLSWFVLQVATDHQREVSHCCSQPNRCVEDVLVSVRSPPCLFQDARRLPSRLWSLLPWQVGILEKMSHRLPKPTSCAAMNTLARSPSQTLDIASIH